MPAPSGAVMWDGSGSSAVECRRLAVRARQRGAEGDEVVADDAESDPALHAGGWRRAHRVPRQPATLQLDPHDRLDTLSPPAQG